MPKQMSGNAFSILLDYYIACLTHEEMLSVTFNVSSEGKTFLSTLFQTETLFHTNDKQVLIKNQDGIKRFFQTSLPRQKKQTLFYGYPIIIGPQGALSPLFFSEINYEHHNDEIVLTLTSEQPQLNHYVLSQEHYSLEEIKKIKQEIEEEDFLSALSHICHILQYQSNTCIRTLDEKPLKCSISPKLINKAILYFGERTNIYHNLIAELTQLKNKPIDDVASTSLLLFLTRNIPSTKTPKDAYPLLEIYPLNTAQEHAVHQSLQNILTVITGPPGTGKSQVVLNIIANAVYNGKTVLFASKNNKAVDVVVQKLDTLLPFRLLVRMGNKEHRRNAKTQLEEVIKQLTQKTTEQQKNKTDILLTLTKITALKEQINQLTTLNDTQETIYQTIQSYLKQLPEECPIQNPTIPMKEIDSIHLQDDLTKFFYTPHILDLLTPKKHQKKQDTCFKKYYDALPSPLKIIVQSLLNKKHAKKITILELILTMKQLELAYEEIHQLKKTKRKYPGFVDLTLQLHHLQNDYITLSRHLFQHHLMNIFIETKNHKKQDILTYFSLSEQLEKGVDNQKIFCHLHQKRLRCFQNSTTFLPIWVVTNLSAKQSLPLKNNLFDILIIDEASQCDIVSALPLFYRAKQAVIIGDPHQLKHISLLTESQDRQLAITHQLSEELFTLLSYTTHSLYDFTEHLMVQNTQHPVLLNEHYRCHPDIISFSNEYYYDKKLTIATDESRLIQHPTLEKRILWHHVKGKTVRSESPYNEEEAERIVEETLQMLSLGSAADVTVGIVTLFRAQCEIIIEKLQKFQDLFTKTITVGTAHRFQGDEKDIILFSPAISDGVKSGTLQWIQTTSQLINVAVTRARSLFIIIGDQETCKNTTGPLKNLSDYVELATANPKTIDSPTKEILYHELKKQGVSVIPNYLISTEPAFWADFALFVNGKRYLIQIQEPHQTGKFLHLEEKNWRIRCFSEQQILTNLLEVTEEIKRFC
jgi:superfamily I DNA and/or RNA helicase